MRFFRAASPIQGKRLVDANAKTVLLDFVKPLRTGRNLMPVGWETELERLQHEANIGALKANANPRTARWDRPKSF
jgi:hypothetical protein